MGAVILVDSQRILCLRGIDGCRFRLEGQCLKAWIGNFDLFSCSCFFRDSFRRFLNHGLFDHIAVSESDSGQQTEDHAQKQQDCLGARMTGAGFGGCAIALVHKDSLEAFITNVQAAYTAAIGYNAGFFACESGDGVSAYQA